MSEEGLKTTANHLIHICQPIPFDTDSFLNRLQILMEAAYDGREADIRRLAAEIVTTYHPAERRTPERTDTIAQKQVEFAAYA